VTTPPVVRRIVSGGQTGVDRAALDVALEPGLECGGWCPRGRRAEDGPIPARYPLSETGSPEYPVRTERNVRDSDATLLLHEGRKGRGTALTARCARRLDRPLLEVDLRRPPSGAALVAWLARHGVGTLNVAGPRESESPGIGLRASALLRELLRPAC
jgi:hypothetical protein